MAQGTPVKAKKRKKSVLKNIRKAGRRTLINRANRTRVSRAIKRLRAALGRGDAPTAEQLLGRTVSAIDRAIRKKALRKNTADRYNSRLSLALNALRAAKTA